MRETERRIRLYQARLPKIKEKLIATLLVFVISITTMAVATFSWLSLSVAPEEQGIATNIAANGNLEIALVSGDGTTLPASSAIGDSLLSIIERNRTWGNLINLSDSAAYGLDKIVLRPASLNPLTLIDKPLSAAKYTADGRVQLLNPDFNYTVYDSQLGFKQSSEYGVRAISSVKYDKIEYENPDALAYANAMQIVEKGSAEAGMIGIDGARSAFNALSNNMDSVAGLIGTYMNSILKDTYNEEPCEPEDIYNFYNLLCKMHDDVVEPVGESFMMMFKLYQTHTAALTKANTNPAELVDYTPADFKTLDEFCAGAMAELAVINRVRTQQAGQSAIVFSSLQQYINDRNTLKADIATLKPDADSFEAGVSVEKTWGDIEPIANHMIKISSVTLNGSDMNTWFGGLPGNVTSLIARLNASASENNVVVTEGMIERFDKLLHNGFGFYVPSITITFSQQALQDKAAEYIGGLGSMAAGMLRNTISANIRTDAVSEMPVSTSKTDIDSANALLGSKITNYTYSAKDTYGLVLDFWLRTNNSSSFLILEGDVIEGDEELVFEDVEYVVYTSSEDGDVTATFEMAEDTPIYVTQIVTSIFSDYTEESGKADDTKPSVSTGEEEDVFKITSGGVDTWYYKRNGEKIPLGEEIRTDIMEGDTVIGTRITTVSFIQDNPPQKVRTKVVGYTGVNRVWTEDKLDPDTINISTTQGSGSCYVFYSDDEVEMNQSLELIKAMKVAFIDAAEGKLLATAHFDVEKKFSEYGRTVVPLYLDTNSNKIRVPDELGLNYSDLSYITPLEKNKAHMITAIVYLDGEQITNDKVLAASDIEGSLNIQFGSYTSPTAMEDEKLIASTRSVTAALVGSYDYSLGDGKEHKVKVELTVEGTTPTEITGRFTRRISETQGSLQSEFVFTNKGEGKWEGEYVFTVPGDFILRTVTVDGIEYVLQQASLPEIEIEGFALESVRGQYGLSYVHRTANSYKTEEFTITVASVDEWPKSVQGIFLGENASIITEYTGSQDEWTATVSFNRSGTYTMSAVIIDGQQYSLANPIVREVYTGLYARVGITPVDIDGYTEEELDGRDLITASGIQYFYAGIPHEFEVSVEIFDDTGKEITGLEKVRLFYDGSGLYDLDADLVWDAEQGSYCGESFLVEEPGVFSFAYVSVGGEIIDRAIGAASITAAPKDPVSYLGIKNEIDNYLVQLNANAAAEEITLAFENAKAASVYGLFKRVTKAEGKDVTSYAILMARNNGNSEHTFVVPAQDGKWTLLDVKVINVFDEESGIFYTGNADAEWPENSSQIITVTDPQAEWYALDNIMNSEGTAIEEDHYYDVDLADVSTLTYKNTVVETKVVANVKVSHNVKSQTFTGTFLQSHEIKDLSATFTDYEGLPIAEEFAVNNVRVDVTYNNNSKAYGGYTGDSVKSYSFTIGMTADASNKTFTQSATQSIVYAGTYSATFYYSVGDTEKSVTGITYTVNSSTPNVAITAIDPSGEVEYSTGDKGSGYGERGVNTFTPTSATVYIKCSQSGCDYEYDPTKLSIQVTNFGYATNATLKFTPASGNVVRIYKDYSASGTNWDPDTQNQTDSYVWTSNEQTLSYYIGYVGGAYNATDSKTPAGNLSASAITLTATVNGQTQTFTVTLTTPITINNPY